MRDVNIRADQQLRRSQITWTELEQIGSGAGSIGDIVLLFEARLLDAASVLHRSMEAGTSFDLSEVDHLFSRAFATGTASGISPRGVARYLVVMMMRMVTVVAGEFTV